MEKYKKKYRIKSARHPYWDYSSNGLYFVTICSQNKEHFFGEIVKLDDLTFPYQMEWSKIGKIANNCWLQIPQHFPFVILHSHIVMPNHIHGIIEIAKNDNDTWVETQDVAALPIMPNLSPSNSFCPQSRNLASIVRGFKIGVTKMAKEINPEFKWQPRYYDHIIRNEKSFHVISNYIKNNPLNWEKDKFYP